MMFGKKRGMVRIKIVIGTRSAVLCPLHNLGLMIIDEEHDQSYKQHEGFRFSARDVSIKRAQVENIPIILGTATPSLQTLKLVKDKKYKQINMLKRANGSEPPGFIVLDINDSKLESGIAKESLDAIEMTLSQNKQVLIFINRRGFSPLYECNSCRWVAECKSCDARLVFHHGLDRLICHRCESAFGVPKTCPECSSSNLSLQGSGTERIELFLEKYFKSKIMRIDSDTINNISKLNSFLEKAKNGDIDILIGTQMLVKGHDFPNLTLVGIIDIDSGLYSLDFRGIEKIAQMIIQVAGRSGRHSTQGKVIIQTRKPNHPIMTKLLKFNNLNFALKNLKQKKELHHPPYTAVSLLRTSSPDSGDGMFVEFSQSIESDISAIGPIPSIITKSRGNFRHHLIIQTTSKTLLNKFAQDIISSVSSWKETKKVKWYFDIDPIDYS